VVDGLQVALAGPSSAANTQHSQLAIAFDNGDAAALDCLELVWQPSGPLSLLFTEVRFLGCLCLSRGCNCLRHLRCRHPMRAQDAMRAYNAVFRALVRLKRAEVLLRDLWSVLHRAGKPAGGMAGITQGRCFLQQDFDLVLLSCCCREHGAGSCPKAVDAADVSRACS